MDFMARMVIGAADLQRDLQATEFEAHRR